MSVTIPNQTVAISAQNGLPTPAFLRWQFDITNAVNTTVPVPPPEPVTGDYLPLSTYVIGDGNILTYGSLGTGGVNLALATLADSGVGTFQLIDTRDAYGRVTGVADGTAADVPYVNTTSGLSAANVQAAVDELSAEKVNDAPSDGSIYGRKDAAWVPAGAGSGAVTLVGTATVTGSAATTLTLSGLSLSADKCYEIVFAFKNATGSSSNVSLFYNGDTTATNYNRQTVQINSTSLSGARANDAFGFNMVASGPATGDMKILADFDGRPRAFIRNSLGAASSIQIHDVRHVRDNTANVTSITLSAAVANSLAVGSYFKVYKVN